MGGEEQRAKTTLNPESKEIDQPCKAKFRAIQQRSSVFVNSIQTWRIATYFNRKFLPPLI